MYLRVWRAVFILSASASASAPSLPTSLLWRLQTRVKQRCQRLLTVGKWVCGNVLKRFERCIDLERLCDVACTFIFQLIIVETANAGQNGVSAAADTCVLVMCGQEGRLAAYSSVWSVEFALRPSERCLAASSLNLLYLTLQTKSRTEVSAAADSRI